MSVDGRGENGLTFALLEDPQPPVVQRNIALLSFQLDDCDSWDVRHFDFSELDLFQSCFDIPDATIRAAHSITQGYFFSRHLPQENLG